MTTFLNSPKLQNRGIVLIDLGKSQLQSRVALKITQSPHGRWGVHERTLEIRKRLDFEEATPCLEIS